jgi:hypothetical protein
MRIVILLGLFGFAFSARAALDLSPFPSEFTGEGITYTQLTFKDDKRQVVYVPPQLWSYRGSSNQLRLTPPANFPKSDATIEKTPLAAPQPLDEKSMEALKQQLLSSLGPSALGVKVVSEEQNPLLINGNVATYEVTVAYQLYGQPFVRSVLFANLPDEQLRFKLSATKADFETLHRAFRSSLISLQWSAKQPAVANTQNAAPPQPSSPN